MDAKLCSMPNCKHQAEYDCLCTSPVVYLCSEHLEQHTKLPNKNHELSALSSIPADGSKEAILLFLENEILKMMKLKKEFITSIRSQICDLMQNFSETLKQTDNEIEKLSNSLEIISKIKKISKFDKDPLIRALSLNPDEAILRAKDIISEFRDSFSDIRNIFKEGETIKKMIKYFREDSIKAFQNKALEIDSLLENCKYSINGNRIVEVKKSIRDLIKIIEKSNKELENLAQNIENESKWQDSYIFRIDKYLDSKLMSLEKIVLAPKIKIPLLNPQKSANLDNSTIIEGERKYVYLIDDYAYLYTFDIKNEIKYKKELKDLRQYRPFCSINQLPNDELFCLCGTCEYNFTLIIGGNDNIRYIPSDRYMIYSTSVYFNKSIYCFGGGSSKFDLDENRWRKLTPMPLRNDYLCNSVIFNGNILVSGYYKKNLCLYSIDIDSFSTIPYGFKKRVRKILINLEGRLYLIECAEDDNSNGFIYESEVANYTAWNLIAKSPIRYVPDLVSCVYNEETLSIGCLCIDMNSGIAEKLDYYKFTLDIPIPIKY